MLYRCSYQIPNSITISNKKNMPLCRQSISFCRKICASSSSWTCKNLLRKAILLNNIKRVAESKIYTSPCDMKLYFLAWCALFSSSTSSFHAKNFSFDWVLWNRTIQYGQKHEKTLLTGNTKKINMIKWTKKIGTFDLLKTTFVLLHQWMKQSRTVYTL